MDKSTDELMKILRNRPDADDFMKEYKNELITQSLPELLLEYLISKNLQIPDVVRDANLDRIYTYQIFDGKHKPSRDKLLCLAFGLHLTTDETQLLLRTAQIFRLDPRFERDILILSCLNQGKTIFDCNDILYAHGNPVLQ